MDKKFSIFKVLFRLIKKEIASSEKPSEIMRSAISDFSRVLQTLNIQDVTITITCPKECLLDPQIVSQLTKANKIAQYYHPPVNIPIHVYILEM